MTGSEFLALLAQHTAAMHPPLCPELCTRESQLMIPIWEEAERLAGKPVEPPFWAYSWAGSQALARYLLDNPHWVAGKRVLDLGCGNGLAALAAARAGALEVTANDVDPAALLITEVHARDNALRVIVEAMDRLDGPPPVPPVEVILAGDLFYARAMSSRVEPWLRRAAAAGAAVLIGDPGRAYLPRQGLLELAAYSVPVPWEIEGVTLRRPSVLALAAGNAASPPFAGG